MSIKSRKVTRLSLPSRRARRYDVVFYTPWIGSILSNRELLPPGGAERQMLLLAKSLARRGLSVAIIAYGDEADLPHEIDGVSIAPRPPYRERPGLAGKLFEIFRIWQALWRTPSHTIVYRCAGIELGVIGVYAKLARRHLVFSSANIVDFHPQKLMTKRRDLFLYRLGVRLADAIVVQTEEQIDLCNRSFGRRPTLIKSISPLSNAPAGPAEAFLWIGRLVSYKRPLAYINLARAFPEARFWMVGVPTPHHDDDRHVVEAVDAASAEVPNLDLLPPRSHDDLKHLLSRAVASVNTADFEGMPNVLLEAWSTGVPALVLTHDPGGVVRKHGLGSFASGSPEALVALAREQWTTRHHRPELARRCRAYIADHHAPELISHQWLSVLSLGMCVTDISPSPAEPDRTEVELPCAG